MEVFLANRMSSQQDFNDESLKDKLGILLDEDNEIKKWHEGLFIKSLILLPIILFVIGLIIINRPVNLSDILFILLYPITLILIGLIILFVMRNNLE